MMVISRPVFADNFLETFILILTRNQQSKVLITFDIRDVDEFVLLVHNYEVHKQAGCRKALIIPQMLKQRRYISFRSYSNVSLIPEVLLMTMMIYIR